MPSPCRRSIQSPTRFGSSRRTSAQSPTGASSGRGRQTRWTLVARAADSRARRRERHLRRDRPRAGDRPAAADHAGEQRLPAFRGLVGEDDAADAVFAQDAPAFGERLGHRLLEERAVLGPAVDVLRLVLHSFASLRRERVRRIERVAQERMAGQRALQPDEEEVGQVGVGNRVVVRRVGEPDVRGLVWQAGCSQRRPAGPAPTRSTSARSQTRRNACPVARRVAAACRLRRRNGFGEVPDHRQRLACRTCAATYSCSSRLPCARTGDTAQQLSPSASAQMPATRSVAMPIALIAAKCHERQLLPRREEVAPLEHAVPLHAEAQRPDRRAAARPAPGRGPSSRRAPIRRGSSRAAPAPSRRPRSRARSAAGSAAPSRLA